MAKGKNERLVEGQQYLGRLVEWCSGSHLNLEADEKKVFGGTVPTPSKLFWNLEETAAKLGISVRTFRDIRELHPFYSPDSSRVIVENPKKDMPLWSESLVQLIAFARTLTEQGVRQLTDDEGLKIRKGMNEQKRAAYLSYIDG